MVTGDEVRTGAAGARATAEVGKARSASAVRAGRTWEEAAEAVLADLDCSVPPDLALVFIDSRFREHYEDAIARLSAGSGAQRLLGASGQAVIGPGYEAEDDPAIAVLAFWLPKLQATTLTLTSSDDVAVAMETIEGASAQVWLLFADPFTFDPEPFARAYSERPGDVPLLGGLASSLGMDGGTALFLDGEVRHGGAVLMGLGGDFGVHAVVAQGAEPIGQPWTITRCEANVVHELGSRPALSVLQETLGRLDDATRQRAQQNLLVGLAMDEYRHQHGRGDYLVRNVVGGDRDSGAIAINAIPRVGQTFQFQFRDAQAADQDLRGHLELFKSRLLPAESVVGALLCACNGRGVGLFGTPHHDAATLEEELGASVPTAGLLCSGEIGPVAGTTFVHGFTASIALLTARGS